MRREHTEMRWGEMMVALATIGIVAFLLRVCARGAPECVTPRAPDLTERAA
jgi:hypothetical protein